MLECFVNVQVALTRLYSSGQTLCSVLTWFDDIPVIQELDASRSRGSVQAQQKLESLQPPLASSPTHSGRTALNSAARPLHHHCWKPFDASIQFPNCKEPTARQLIIRHYFSHFSYNLSNVKIPLLEPLSPAASYTMAYVAPIHRPSSVRHALRINLLSPEEESLIITYGPLYPFSCMIIFADSSALGKRIA